MGIPFVAFLLLYVIAASCIMVFASFTLYHAVKYALTSSVSIVVTTIFVCGLLGILIMSGVTISQVAWDQVLYFSIL